MAQLPLHGEHARSGARFRDYHGWAVPGFYSDPSIEYQMLRQAAGVMDVSLRGKIQVTGEDRADFLHRMLTNEIRSLAPGESTYCFFLNAQGHILADMNVLVEADRILLDCEPHLTARVAELIERFIIMDQVELEDITSQVGTIYVGGPAAGSIAGIQAGGPASIRLWFGGYHVMPDIGSLPAVWLQLSGAAAAHNGGAIGFAAYDVLRIEDGVPLYGADMDEHTLAPEIGLAAAISYTKGCYPGQEIVERIRSRGHVNRRLAGLIAAKPLAPKSPVVGGGKPIGEVRSATHSASLGQAVALAYLRREFLEPGTKVEVEGQSVEVAALPFPGIRRYSATS